METNRENLKPVIKLNYALSLGLLFLSAVETIALFVGVWRVLTYVLLPGNSVLEGRPFLVDHVYPIVGQIQGFANLPVSIMFGIWLYRMNFNLRKLTTWNMEFTPGWMIGWYFIPFANFFKPFQGMRELWRVSHKQWYVDPSILRWWWGLWLAVRFVGNSSLPIGYGPDVVQNIINSTLFFILIDGLNVALDIVALRITASIWVAYGANYIKGENQLIDEDVAIQLLKENEKNSI